MDRPKENILGGKIVAFVPQSRYVGQFAKRLIEILNHAVGSI